MIAKTIIWFLIALVPSAFWLWFFLRYDWKRPEPARLILKTFVLSVLFGSFVVFMRFFGWSYLFENLTQFNWLNNLIYVFLGVAFVEEMLKFLTMYVGIFKNKFFDEYVDGIIYGVTVGLGFAAMENIFSVFVYGSEAVLFRFATSTLMHALVGGFMGYFFSKIKFEKKFANRFCIAIYIPTLLHGIYNILSQIKNSLGLTLMSVFLVLMFLGLILLIKKAQRKTPAFLKNKT